ncbi:MAG: Gldg family protein [Planctomycetota bacterium]
MGRTRMSRAAERNNSLLTVLLLAGIVVAGNRLAGEHLAFRHDFSQDQLYAVSDATRSILGRLEDRLQVKTYFTGHIEAGEVLLAKARIEAQLAELAAIAGRHMEVVALDPSTSTVAANEALSYRIQPRTVQSQGSTGSVLQPVYLGILLRYRGREHVLDFVIDPWAFEIQFASAVHTLVRDAQVVVGWFEDEPQDMRPLDVAQAHFKNARALLDRRHQVRDVEDLRHGQAVSEEIDILIVVRPLEQHPRVAFELDQFVQRGGKLVVLWDQIDYNYLSLQRRGAPGAAVQETGLETLLRAWGALPTPQHVWDDPWQASYFWYRPIPNVQPGESTVMREPGATPLFIRLQAGGFDPSHPVTAGLQTVTLSWAQPINVEVPPPGGLERMTLLRSSDDAYRTTPKAAHVVLPKPISGMTQALYAEGRGRSYALGVALEGRFPSPFVDGAPAPFDPFHEGGAGRSTTDETVLSAAAESQVVVFGDADWLRDPDREGWYPFLNADGNQALFMNVIDWLTLDEELIALRRRIPRDRALFDFETEARRELGLEHLSLSDTRQEFDLRLELEEQARSLAQRKRWQSMLLPLLVTLAAVAVFGLAFNLAQRRRRRA